MVIGEDSIIVSQVGISGSTKLGGNVTVGGQAGFMGHINIGDDVMIGAQSGVMNDIASNQVYTGSPAVPHREFLRTVAVYLKLPDMKKTLSDIEKRLEKIERPDAPNNKEKKMIDIRGIMRLLPHNYPFLLVDRILEIEPGKRIVGIKNVTYNEPFFPGHFPGKPIMPLYHIAILYPTRPALADALRRLIAAGVPLEGASDHGVSEALYLRDPDENGLELYWDRPEAQWPRTADGHLTMFTRPLDLDNLLSELPTADLTK